MSNQHLLILFPLLAGALIPLQAALNAMAGRALNHPLQATLVNFSGGLIALFLLLLIVRPQLPSKAQLSGMPWYAYMGGCLGVIFVTVVLTTIPRLGAVLTLGAIIAGQLAASVAFDHYGILGIQQQAATPMRLAGVALLFAGLVMIRKG